MKLERFARSLEGIPASGAFMQIFNPAMTDPEADVTPLVQLAMAIMLDKPIVILALEDRGALPDHLRRVADEVVTVREINADAAQEVAAALERVQGGPRG